jgi:hypothetical protein
MKLPEKIEAGQGGWIQDTEQAYRTINWLVETVTALIFVVCALVLAIVVIVGMVKYR